MSRNNNQVLAYMVIMTLIWFTVIIFLSSNASAQVLTNGGFETGDITGWTHVHPEGTMTVEYMDAAYGAYSLRATMVGTWTAVSQTFSLNGREYIGFDLDGNGTHIRVELYDDGVEFFQGDYYHDGMIHLTRDISGRTGTGKVILEFTPTLDGTVQWFDNITIDGYVIPLPYADSSINFDPDVNITEIKPVLCDYTIHPDDLNYYYDNDTKRVGNTVEIINWWQSNASQELPPLWISEGFTDSNISGSHTLEYCDSYNSIYEIELRASWYELEGGSWLWHHGIDGILLANDTILWDLNYTYPDPEPDPDPYDPPDPYEPPEIPPPPMPDDWNMTIPDKYQNVTWLTNYTTYFDDMGSTFNTTLYSVSGWVISPLTSLNNTVYSLRYYIANTHDMVTDLSHLHLIVNYGWAVIPNEIKSIFTGGAAIGVCIYLFKRRT